MTLNISTLTPPAWTEPGAQPELLQLADGRILFTWARTVSDAVWIVCEDDVDPIVAGPTRVHVAEHRDGLTPDAARELATALATAAELAAASQP